MVKRVRVCRAFWGLAGLGGSGFAAFAGSSGFRSARVYTGFRIQRVRWNRVCRRFRVSGVQEPTLNPKPLTLILNPKP